MFWYLILNAGVLLLNACLTVRQREANSHAGKVGLAHTSTFSSTWSVHCWRWPQGWEALTDAVIRWINNNLRGVVFLLWGSYAQKKGGFINKVGGQVVILVSPHLTWLSSFSSARRGTMCWRLSTLRLFRLAEGSSAAAISRRQTGYSLPKETNPSTGRGFPPRLTTSSLRNVCHWLFWTVCSWYSYPFSYL